VVPFQYRVRQPRLKVKIISTQISEQKILMWFLSQNIPKRDKPAEKISQKNPDYMLNYALPYSCSYNLSSFWFVIKRKLTTKEISIFKGNYFEEFLVKPEMEATLGALCFNIGGIKEPHFFHLLSYLVLKWCTNQKCSCIKKTVDFRFVYLSGLRNFGTEYRTTLHKRFG
jgi:hypothetical protein